MKILYVDPDKDDREFFCEAVQAMLPDVELICVSSCSEAVELLNEGFSPDTLFIDAYLTWVVDNECLTALMTSVTQIPVINYSGLNRAPRHYENPRNFKFMPKPQSYNEIVGYLRKEFGLIGH